MVPQKTAEIGGVEPPFLSPLGVCVCACVRACVCGLIYFYVGVCRVGRDTWPHMMCVCASVYGVKVLV